MQNNVTNNNFMIHEEHLNSYSRPMLSFRQNWENILKTRSTAVYYIIHDIQPTDVWYHYSPQQDVLLEMVRKKVAVPLKMLLSHGLRSEKKESLALVSCGTKSRQYSKGVHPWTLFLQFYKLQVSHEYSHLTTNWILSSGFNNLLMLPS